MRFGKYNILLLALLLNATLSACFTGVEGTKKITEKDVSKYIKVSTVEERQASSLEVPQQRYSQWLLGKTFYVCDDNARLIFDVSDKYLADTLSLKGRTLRFAGTETGSVLDNRDIVRLRFTDGVNEYVYSTGKTDAEITETFAVPFLIDTDIVVYVAGELCNKEFYIKTSLWYDGREQLTQGRKYVKVRIEAVEPGNKVFPVKVRFSDCETGENAFVWMTLGGTALRNRSFDALFSLTDIRERYPNLTDDVWQCVIHGKVKEGMTKDEVRLALGAPTSVSERPSYGGLREYWQYGDGTYLFFEDGILVRR